MATSLAPVATSHSDMTEASLNGYVVDCHITIREENLKRLFVIKHVVDGSHHHLTILLLDALDYSLIKLGSVCRKILDAPAKGA